MQNNIAITKTLPWRTTSLHILSSNPDHIPIEKKQQGRCQEQALDSNTQTKLFSVPSDARTHLLIPQNACVPAIPGLEKEVDSEACRLPSWTCQVSCHKCFKAYRYKANTTTSAMDRFGHRAKTRAPLDMRIPTLELVADVQSSRGRQNR